MQKLLALSAIALMAAVGVWTGSARAEEAGLAVEPHLLAQGPTRQAPGSAPIPVPPAGTPKTQPGQTTGPKPSTGPPTAPPAGPITLDPGKHGPKQHIVPKPDELKALEDEIQKAQKVIEGKTYSHSLWYLDQKSKVCVKTNYTAEDQKAAGCQGSDTLDQCKSKLYHWCMDVKHASEEKGFVIQGQSVLKAAEQLAEAAKQYATKVKQAMEAYSP